jgi:branched-chain amino acid transport system ATP-binding protein
MNTPALEVLKLSGGYGPKPVLDGVNLVVPAGSIVLLAGRNGSGKTTALRGLMGLLPDCRGAVRWEGRPLIGPPHRLRGKGIVYVPQRHPVFATVSVDVNLRLALAAIPRHLRMDRREKTLEWFPSVADRLLQKAGTLSGGERQLLGLACAVASRPRILLVDEPTGGLAPTLRRRILSMIREIATAEDLAVLLVEHDVRNAVRVADSVVGLRLGRVIVDCPVQQFDDAMQRKVFLE